MRADPISSSEVTVRFVAAPFLPEHQPALGVSSLCSVLATQGISADIKYLNLAYAKSIGHDIHKYITIANPPNFLLGEMVFAEAVWGGNDEAWNLFIRRLLRAWEEPAYRGRRPQNLEMLLAKVAELRKAAPTVVQKWAKEILKGKPRIVGFTTTFQQNMASIAIAKELRRLAPPSELAIIFGGANCEGQMGQAIAEHFPFVDYVLSGEGENAIVDLTLQILEIDCSERVQTVRPRWSTGRMVDSMDDLPPPDFSHYFEAVKVSGIGTTPNLVAESSRGCWWGMKSHCTFCGLNGQTMQYRSKQPERFANELRLLSKRYGPTYFSMADNILDMKYVRTLFPQLAGSDEPITFFYEVKANLRRDHLELMAAGGVVRLQPGIESLSTKILQLMGKGTSRLQNIQLLKWCREYGIDVAWNLLYGFPGEDPAEYAGMASLIPLLSHLQPPMGSGPVRIDRFSPYWRSPDRFDISNLRQFWSYDFVYSGIPKEDRIGFAYYFDFDHPTLGDPVLYCRDMLEALDYWRGASNAMLELRRDLELLTVRDTRTTNEVNDVQISAIELLVLQHFDSHGSRSKCFEEIRAKIGSASTAISDLESIVSSFVDRKWLIVEGDQLLSLVVDRSNFNRVVDLRVRLQLQHLGLSDIEPDRPGSTEVIPSHFSILRGREPHSGLPNF
jgi:ribosomal peptide maturation radical SAM protein 1